MTCYNLFIHSLVNWLYIMNIFFTNPNPAVCATEHCNIHLNKMIVEYAQLLSTAHRLLDGEQYIEITDKGRKIKRWHLPSINADTILYKASHVNHPSNRWVRESSQHYDWLFNTWSCMLDIKREMKGGEDCKAASLKPFLVKHPANIKDNSFVAPYVAIQPNDHPDIHEMLNDDSIDTLGAYRIFMNRKFKNWVTRTDKRKMYPDWAHSRIPLWVQILIM